MENKETDTHKKTKEPATDAFIENMRGSLTKLGMPSQMERDPDREFVQTECGRKAELGY